MDVSQTAKDTAIVAMKCDKKQYPTFRMVPFRMTLSDLEWLSEIFNDTKHRAVSVTSGLRVCSTLELMGCLLHLVQRRGNWAGPQPTQAPPRCTKCNSPPINGQCTITALLCGFIGPIKKVKGDCVKLKLHPPRRDVMTSSNVLLSYA